MLEKWQIENCGWRFTHSTTYTDYYVWDHGSMPMNLSYCPIDNSLIISREECTKASAMQLFEGKIESLRDLQYLMFELLKIEKPNPNG